MLVNIFSISASIVLFAEMIFVLSLIKPVTEPHLIRSYWYRLHARINPGVVVAILILSLILNTMLEITYDEIAYQELLSQVKDPKLVREFYVAKFSSSYMIFFMTLYLFLVIESVVQTTLLMARLLDHELMCRRAVLLGDEGMEKPQYTTISVLAKPSHH